MASDGGIFALYFWVAPLLALAAIIGIIVFCIIAFVKLIKKAKKGSPKHRKYYFFSIGCVLLAAVSFIFNLGWLRVFLLWFFPIPLGYAALFLVSSFFAIRRFGDKPILKPLTLCSFAAYLLTYFCLPDVGDYGPAYAFFTLIRGDWVMAFIYLSVLFGIASITLIVLLFCFSLSGKEKKLENPVVPEENE